MMNPDPVNSWTFGICFGGQEHERLNKIVESIERQNIPEYEILIIGSQTDIPNTRHIFFDDGTPLPWITRKKNMIAQFSQHENLCLLHDYFALNDGWFEGFEKFGYNWDVAMTPLYKINGERYLDWLKINHHEFLDYNDHSQTQLMYISGGYIITKTNYMRRNPFNEGLYWGQAEDIEWSERLNHTWTYRCNTFSSARLIKGGK